MKLPLIAQRARHEASRHANAVRRAAQPLTRSAVTGVVTRRAALAPIRKQLVERTRLEHGARHDVRADGRALLDDTDRELAVRRARELREPARRRKTRRPGADDDDIELHGFA